MNISTFTAQPSVQARSLVFIDAQLPDLQTLIAALPDGSEHHLIAADRDGLAQIAAALAGRCDIDALHILSHGRDGAVLLGSSWVDSTALARYPHELDAIAQAMSADGNILLYACELGQSAKGRAFVRALSDTLGTDVAAASGPVGHVSLGANWQLNVGQLHATALNVPHWQGRLGLTTSALTQATYNRSTEEWKNVVAFAALRADGSVVTWGDANNGGNSNAVSVKLDGTNDVTQIFSSSGAFAALCVDGSVVTWGNSTEGGDSSTVASNINGLDNSKDVKQVFSTRSAFAALRADGSVVTWGSANSGGDSSAEAALLDGRIHVTKVYSTEDAFAALRSDGSVITWGSDSGGNSAGVAGSINGADDKKDVVDVFSTETAFAALRKDGSVVAWGNFTNGANTYAVATQLNGTTPVDHIFSTGYAFAALRHDGSVVVWGAAAYGGDSSSVGTALSGGTRPVINVFSTEMAFAALVADNSVVTWGSAIAGGDSSAIKDQLINVKSIFSTSGAFAALRSDNTVVTWGNSTKGGDSSAVASQLTHVKEIFSTASAFAALREDGTVVTWGGSAYGGDSGAVTNLTNVTEIYSTGYAFAALRADGTMVTWGGSTYGGDSSAVASKLTNVVSMANALTNDVYVADTQSGDKTPPTVTTFSPADEATNAGVSSNIVITFSEDINLGTGAITLKKADGTVVETFSATHGQVSASGKVLTINPTADLAYSTGYKIELAAGAVKDLAGNSYAGTSSYNFTTAATNTQTSDTLLFPGGIEDTAKTITFANLKTLSQLSNSAYEVQNVSSGTLTIGGKPYDAATNKTIDAYHSASWTPSADANGSGMAAFTVKPTQGWFDAPTSKVFQINVDVAAVNDAPTLTAIAALTGNAEGSARAISFADLQGAADEKDVDGTVTAFVVQAKTSGTLKIGSDLASAKDFAVGSNEVVDATHIAYWAPADVSTAGSTLDAFTVKAKDNDGLLSKDDAVKVQVKIPQINHAPVITGGATAAFSLEENKSAVTTVKATDTDSRDSLIFSLIGGVDKDLFDINSSTGELSFKKAPDYETPADSNKDNAYLVDVSVSDGNGGTASQTITVKVTNVVETSTPTDPVIHIELPSSVDVATKNFSNGNLKDFLTSEAGITQNSALYTAVSNGIDKNLGADSVAARKFSLTGAANSAVKISGTADNKEALVVDAKLQADTKVVVSEIDFAIVVGTAKIELDAGKTTVFGDDASQTFIFSAEDNAIIDGGKGIDLAVFNGTHADYSLSHSGSTWTVKNTGVDVGSLTNIERLQFADKKIAIDLDTTGHAGQAMEFIGVVAPSQLNDTSTRGKIISLFDQGETLKSLSQQALDLKLLPATTNIELANAVYHNVLGDTATQDMMNSLVGYIEAHGQADFLATVAGLHLNVDLVGLQLTGGVEYTI